MCIDFGEWTLDVNEWTRKSSFEIGPGRTGYHYSLPGTLFTTFLSGTEPGRAPFIVRHS